MIYVGVTLVLQMHQKRSQQSSKYPGTRLLQLVGRTTQNSKFVAQISATFLLKIFPLQRRMAKNNLGSVSVQARKKFGEGSRPFFFFAVPLLFPCGRTFRTQINLQIGLVWEANLYKGKAKISPQSTNMLVTWEGSYTSMLEMLCLGLTNEKGKGKRSLS